MSTTQYSKNLCTDIFGLTTTLEKPTRGKPVREGFLLFRASEKKLFYNPKLLLDFCAKNSYCCTTATTLTDVLIALKFVLKILKIRAQKIKTVRPLISVSHSYTDCTKFPRKLCILLLSGFLCQNCCTTPLEFMPSLPHKSAVRPPQFLC